MVSLLWLAAGLPARRTAGNTGRGGGPYTESAGAQGDYFACFARNARHDFYTLNCMEQSPCPGCQQVLAEVKVLRDEVAILRGLLAQEIARRRFSWRRVARRLLIIYALFMLYVFGMGPAVMLAERWEPADGVVEVLIAPLDMLCEAVPALEPPIAGYLALWKPAEANVPPANAPPPAPATGPDPAADQDD